MIDPVSALAAVQSAVKLIKQASKTVDDVASLGPMIGKYFDAKATATKAAREAKKAGGSNMGKAIEIELALKSQADFERELQNLFFASNNMDVWQNIMKRVAEMNAADADDAKRDAIEAAKRKREEEFQNEVLMAALVVIFVLSVVGYSIYAAMDFCSGARCGR
jgi:preprotein translocase subunit Sss1